MATMFNAGEVLEMAEQIERNGRRFYQTAAQQARDDRTRAVLQRLAEMEADHELLFTEMQAQAVEEGLPDVEYDPDQQVPLYLQAAADTHVFNVHKDLPSSVSARQSPAEVLKLAIQFEKDSVVFFLGVKELVPENLGKEKLDALIREEMSHVVTLTSELRALESESL